jgi:hypothetical protein
MILKGASWKRNAIHIHPAQEEYLLPWSGEMNKYETGKTVYFELKMVWICDRWLFMDFGV